MLFTEIEEYNPKIWQNSQVWRSECNTYEIRFRDNCWGVSVEPRYLCHHIGVGVIGLTRSFDAAVKKIKKYAKSYIPLELGKPKKANRGFVKVK